MARLPIGPADIAPRLRCEQLEDRSLLSATTLFSTFGDAVFAEPMPGEELPADGVLLEEGLALVPYLEGTIRTCEFVEGRDGFLTEESWGDSWSCEEEYWDGSESYDESADASYYEDESYYEDLWYYEDEVYYEDDWYYEEEYWDESWYAEDEVYYEEDWYYEDPYYEENWDDSWYYQDEVYLEEEYWNDAWSTDEAYANESWDGEIEFVDSGWMTWDGPDPFLAWTDFDDGMVYAMAVAGGIAVSDEPAVPAITDVAEILPLPLPTPETHVDAAVAPALPPVTTAIDSAVPHEVVVPPAEVNEELADPAAIEESESGAAATPGLPAPSSSDDHLTEEESLELSEDLPVG
jgi:hypothetical protein